MPIAIPLKAEPSNESLHIASVDEASAPVVKVPPSSSLYNGRTYINGHAKSDETNGTSKRYLEPIAITGIGCRLPGGVSSSSDLWNFTLNSQSGRGEVPKSRFNANGFYHPNSDLPGTINSRGGYFLEEDVRLFDNSFFGLNNLETQYLDTQQRKLLEVVFECIEDAGLRKEDVSGTNVGCYVANFTNDFQIMQLKDPEMYHRYSATGLATAILANRVSYTFNLRGPSVVVDTACSSSLYALHMACTALNTGECDAAIVAGANLVQSPELHMGVARAGMLSATYTCHTFDESADGYGRAEGVGALFLKRIPDAVQNNDSIRSIIRGTAVNSNGKTDGITLPSASGQEAVIRRAYATAGLDPTETEYVEAHGTGTQAGDPIELEGLARAFGIHRRDPLLVGSVKTNFGHSEGVSGITSIIKATLALENSLIPPTIGVEKINPKIRLDEWNIKVVTEPTPMRSNKASRISVNSFGFGGANGHAILESAASYLGLEHQIQVAEQASFSPRSHLILPFSASDRTALERRVSEIEFQNLTGGKLRDLTYHLATRRSMLPVRGYYKLDAVCDRFVLDPKKLISKDFKSVSKGMKLAFVFPGQGAQWPGMGRLLIKQYSRYAETIQLLDRELSSLNDSPTWKLEDILSSADAIVHHAEYSQPLTTATQIALVDLLKSWGIQAEALVGHSSGEIAAAYAAGYLDAAEAISIAYYRGLLVSRLDVPGGMAAVGTSYDTAYELITKHGFTGQLVVGAVNSPISVTITGDADSIDRFVSILDKSSIFTRKLKTDNKAYHSHHMESLVETYSDKTAAVLRMRAEKFTAAQDALVFSSVTGKLIGSKEMRDPDYWSTNLRSPVLFSDAAAELYASNSYTTIEIGPHPALSMPLKQIRADIGMKESQSVHLGTLNRQMDDLESITQMIGGLFLNGYAVDFMAVNHSTLLPDLPLTIQSKPLHNLPPYPWQYSQQNMNESRISSEYRQREYPRHDLLGSRIPGGDHRLATWRSFVSLSLVPWLNDHKVESSVVFPGAAYLAMAIEAKRQLQPNGIGVSMRDINFVRALLIGENDGEIEMFTHLKPMEISPLESSNSWHHFEIVSYINSNPTVHANGLIKLDDSNLSSLPSLQRPFSSLENRPVKSYYDRLSFKGLTFGPGMRTINHIAKESGSSRMKGKASWVDGQTPGHEHDSRHLIHPITIDALFQAGIMSTAHVFPRGIQRIVPRSIEAVNIAPRSLVTAQSSREFEFQADSDRVGPGAALINAQLVGASEIIAQVAGIRAVGFPYSDPSFNKEDERSPILQIKWKPDISKFIDHRSPALTAYVDKLAAAQPASMSSKANRRIAGLLDLISHQDTTRRVLMLGDDNLETTTCLLDLLGMGSALKRVKSYTQLKVMGGVLKVRSLDSAQVSGARDDELVELSENQKFDVVVLLQTPRRINLSASHIDSIKRSLSSKAIAIASEKDLGIIFHLKGPESVRILTLPKAELPEVALTKLNSNLQINNVKQLPPTVLVKRDKSQYLPDEFIDVLKQRFTEDIVTISLQESSSNTIPTDSIIISTVELHESLLATATENELNLIKSLTNRASILLWVTGGGLLTAKEPNFSAVSGLSRALMLEQPALKFAVVDVDPNQSGSADLAEHISTILGELRENENADLEYSLRDGLIYISRFAPERGMNQLFRERQNIHDGLAPLKDVGRCQLSMRTPGQLDSVNFVQEERDTPELPNDYVEVQTKFFGLNAKDVYVLTNKVDSPKGNSSFELSGVVTSIGKNVTDFNPGDRVVVMAPNPCATYTQIPEWCCLKLQDNEEISTACTLPIVNSTAIYALKDRARLQEGESILIHSGASAVGIAAIQLAQHLGANVFTTVSTEEKKRFVVEVLKVKESNVLLLDSFLPELMKLTQGEGVDVVLNHLFGENLKASLQACADFGRFVEIGKRDILDKAKLGMEVFVRDITFTAFDLANQFNSKSKKQNQSWKRLLHESIKLWRNGTIKPRGPIDVYDVSEISTALKQQSRRSRIGKIVVSLENPNSLVKFVPQTYQATFDPTKTYLMIGCLGGLGRRLARWMFERRARKFVFLQRSGTDREPARLLVEELRARGATISVTRGSVTDAEEVNRAVQQIYGPIGGVFFSAMGIDAALFSDMSAGAWHTGLDPKIKGSWNVHNALKSRGDQLDFFILLSSISGSVGSATESNYCAANAFQDAFARYRRSLGLPATSIGLGLISDAGYVHERPDVESLLLRKGVHPLSSEEFLQLVDLALTNEGGCDPVINQEHFTQAHFVTGLEATSLQWLVRQGFASGSPVQGDPRMSVLTSQAVHGRATDNLSGDGSSYPAPVATALAYCSPNSGGEATEKLHSAVQDEIVKKTANLMLVDAEKLGTGTSLNEFGMDSMLAAEFKTSIYNSFRADIPFPVLLDKGVTIGSISGIIVDTLLRTRTGS